MKLKVFALAKAWFDWLIGTDAICCFVFNSLTRVLPIQAANGSCESPVSLASAILSYFLGAAPVSASATKLPA